ncbi:MAG: MarR family transcriptional regulator [Gemmatimonadaceae bacterium]
MSASTAHGSVERLQVAGLLRPDSREVNRHYLLEFLEHGVKYAFPAALRSRAKGIGTAHSGPALSKEIIADDAIVWPDAHGNVVGQAIPPLWETADLPNKCPFVYDLLTLVDAVRIGRARERSKAVELLRQRLAFAT